MTKRMLSDAAADAKRAMDLAELVKESAIKE